MTVLAAIADLRLEFENDDLLAAPVFFGGRYYFGAIHDGLTESDILAFADSKDFIDFHGITFGNIEPFHVDGLAFGYLVLLATCFDNRVNFGPRFYVGIIPETRVL